MKRFLTLISIITAVFFIGCDSSMTAPEETQTYNGMTIQEVEAPFLLNDETLARLEMDEVLPEGTVYGNVNVSDDVYRAVGGELLPAGTWLANAYDVAFNSHIGSEAVVYFAEPAYVTLLNPVDVLYLDENDQWHFADNTISVTANGLLTGADGACRFITDAQFGIGGEGSDNAVLSYFGIGGEGSDNEILSAFGIGGEGSDNSVLAAFGIGGEGSDNFGIGGEGSDNALLVYNGITVTTTPAPFLLNNILASEDLTGTQVRLPLPAGTVYGHEDYPGQVFLAVGGEELPEGSWVDNAYDYAYVSDVYGNTGITFVELALVSITEAINTQYQNAAGDWISITGNGIVWAHSIQTGVDGGCIIDTGVKFDIGGEGGDNG